LELSRNCKNDNNPKYWAPFCISWFMIYPDLWRTSDPPRLRMGAVMILKCFSDILCMFCTYKSSSWILYLLKNRIKICWVVLKDLSIQRTDIGNNFVLYYVVMILQYMALLGPKSLHLLFYNSSLISWYLSKGRHYNVYSGIFTA
jgi:hypothetical protein